MRHFVPDSPNHPSSAHRYGLPRMSTGVKLAASFTAILVAVLAFVARGCVAEVVAASPFHSLHTVSPDTSMHATPQRAATSVIQFDPEEETLTQDGAATLEAVAQTMKADPSATLHLSSTLNTKTAAPNRGGLASLRAQTISQFMAARGVNRSRLSGAGFQSAGVVRPAGLVGGDATRNDRGRVEFSLQ